MKVFISYVRQSAPPKRVMAFRDRLQAELALISPGSIVFIDQTMHAGQHFPSELRQQLDEASVLLVLLTSAWLKSRWCREEFNHFTRNSLDENRLRRIVPVLWAETLELTEESDDVIARSLYQINWSDWRKLRFRDFGGGPMGAHFAKLAEALVKASDYQTPGRPSIPQPLNTPEQQDHEIPPLPESVVYGPDSDYQKDIRSLMIEVLSPSEIHIDRFVFNDSATISDLEATCARVLYAKRDPGEVSRQVIEARRVAYTQKYAVQRQDDEKLFLDNTHGPWTRYLQSLLDAKGITGVERARVIDVGLGTGQAYVVDSFFSRLRNLTAVDLSARALQMATQHLPSIRPLVGDGEELSDVPNASQDVYFSFRTYNSTLFHRRRAVWEACRILAPGGVAVVSIPRIYYVHKTGQVFPGLGNARQKISQQYLWRVVNDVRQHFEALGFRDVSTYDKSPYEIFVFARRT